MSRPIRVMVVDDSAVIRGLLKRALETDPEITVVTTVSNGKLAVEQVADAGIEVVVLDIEMPVMDGMAALPKIIAAQPGVQVIMASTLTRKNADISLQAMKAGAADYIPKPTSSMALNSADDFKRLLTEKVKALGLVARQAGVKGTESKSFRAESGRAPAVVSALKPRGPITLRPGGTLAPNAIAIGCSTGGPQALLSIVSQLKAPVRLPIFVTQHMPATFTTLLAEHISRVSPAPCSEGKDGEPVAPGRIYLAPGDFHMLVETSAGKPRIRLDQGQPENFCRPAVDPMLRSLVGVYGARLLVVILTGMGSDGLRGAKSVVEAGGTVVAQDAATSVVWGMPGAVANAGLCSAVMPLDQIAPHIQNVLMRSAA